MKRPVPVVAIACLYLLVGVVGFIAHFPELRNHHADAVGIEVTELLAVVSGIFLLQRKNWARWLAIAWIAFHVAISGFDSLQALIIHSLLLVVFAYFLFRAQARQYFRQQSSGLVT